MACFWPASPAGAQQSIAVTGDRLSGFVLPIAPIDARIQVNALRAKAWTVDDTKRLLLSGDVTISIGSHQFIASEAVVWLNRIPSADGTINQIAIFFDEVDDPSKQPGISASGGPLMVTASARGDVKLNAALLDELKPSQAPQDSIVRRGERRLAEHLRRLAGTPPPLQNEPILEQPQQEAPFVPNPGGRVHEPDVKLPKRIELPPTETPTPWLAGPQGVVRFSAQRIEIARGDTESVITLIGPIVVDAIADRRSEGPPPLTLTALRAVIFADPSQPGSMSGTGGEMDAQAVRGIYLEGNVNVITHDGQYAIRAPQMYYDLRTQQAIMLDALLRIMPGDSRIPVYARAQEMRQLAQNQWDAKRVSVSTSEFHTPHIAIGARQMIVTQAVTPADEGEPSASDRTKIHLDSSGNALEFSGVPLVPWPRFRGNVEDVPLRSIEVGTRRHDGLRILTAWDLFTLSGIERPIGVDAQLKVDGFTKRGGGLGLDFRYDVGDSEGRVDLYGLFDEGIDRTSSGRDVEPDNKFRGVALLEHQMNFDRYWSLQAQASLISDETFMTSWREDDFLEHREYETSLHLKHQRDNTAITLLGKYSLQDFLSNDYLLASRQYSVNKAPELTYRRYGDSLFADRFTYSMENRLTRMQLAFQRTTLAEIGARPGAFDIDDDVPISDSLRAQGLRENWVSRFDSRHELSMPLNSGAIKVTPFVVGRFTGYDDDFEEFSSDADEMRFFGAGGVRINAQLQRVDNSVENQLFDLHRMRHLIEPYVTLWSAHANVSQDELPIYDEEVESIADGSAVQVGVRNTWQTQRAAPPPGMWRSVDWLTLDTSVVFDDKGEPDESPTPQFFDYRPEYSQFGDHLRATLIWLLSDSLALTGETTYALDDTEFARSSIGAELRHSPLLTMYIEYRVIEVSENELLAVNWTYQLTPKYRLSLTPQYDFREEDLRSLSGRLTRSFPDFEFTLHVRYDQIRDDTSVGASLGLVEF
jgi:hypothetical protein